MAIGVNIQGPAFKLTGEEATGQPNYYDALMKGVGGAQKMRESAANLIQTHLKNKQAQLDIANAPLKQRLLEAQIARAQRAPQLTGDAATLEYIIKNKDRLNSLTDNIRSDQQQESFLPSIPGVNQQQVENESGESYVPSIGARGREMPAQSAGEGEQNLGFGDKLLQHYMDKFSGGNAAYQGPARYAADLERLKREKGESSPEYQYAKSLADSRIQASEDLNKIRQRQLEGFKPGEKPITNSQGEIIGKSRNKTEKERDIDRGTSYFDTTFPLVNEALNYYSGEGSITRLQNDAENYKTDPAARRRFDQFLVADKLKTITGVTEAARAGAGKTNKVFDRFYTTLSSFDVPNFLKEAIKQNEIPYTANIKAGQEFQRLLNLSKNNYEKNARPTVDEYFPGYSAPNQQNKQEESFDGETWDIDENGNPVRVQ